MLSGYGAEGIPGGFQGEEPVLPCPTKCDKVNIKLDSSQSESDRGESQLNVARAACWLHYLLPSHWIDEHRSLCILDISPGALSLSILSKSLISVCRTLLNSRSSD